MSLWHKFQHLFGWNSGRVISAFDEGGNIWIAFQCSECGKVSGRHVSLVEVRG